MDEELRKYIVCWSNCTLRHIESLAMIGLVERVEVADCEKKGFKKLVARLVDGSIVDSSCYYTEEAAQSLRIINLYIGFARSRGQLGKVKIAGGEASLE